MFCIPSAELTAYQHNPDFEIRCHNTPILQLSRKQLLDLSRSVVIARSGLLSFASVSRSVQWQFTPGSRLQSLFDPPPRHRQLQPLVSAVSPPGSTYGYGETMEGQEGKEKLVTVSVQACAK